MPSTKRTEILRAAEEILSRKGKKATIAEIAAKAGVAVSVIYHYFQNKEDLIFSVIEERLNGVIGDLDHHLTAIRDPVSKLSKTIWLQLRVHHDYPDYTNLLMFECRSSARFRKHDAFKAIKKWSDIIRLTLIEGVESGAFAADLDVILARDAILGLLDIENLFSLAAGKPEQGLDDVDRIVEMVLGMIAPSSDRPQKNKDLAARILLEAERVFAAKGYENATMTSIAGLAGVSEGTIYEYYKNKEDLLFSVMDARFESQIESLVEIFQVVSPIRKLRRFFKYHFLLYATQPLFTRIFLGDGIYNKSFFQSRAYEKLMKYLGVIEEIVAEGQAGGSIRPDLDRRLFRNLFLGAFTHLTLRWQLSEQGADLDKIRELNGIVDLLTNFLERGAD
ncbi:MAG: TetR/AcrR family transcriptional regulator [Pseudomonadota bacterium]